MIQLTLIFIVFSLVMYLFYKIKTFRTKAPVMKRWVQTKANMSLGVFLTAFGANLLITSRGSVDIIVGTVFSLLGLANIILGFRAYKLYLPYAAKEAEEQRVNA
ncbi:YtpI family protein [Alteribacillus iranensis]|uniref:YtpI-like protein n=1 Tax=Alteribacillus iranensis TaxID=930128 RepID=A0A1I2CIN8_9BACI|nr:YtpI family protein [Alteribacillus iranensis]SFE68176.1 YtpI-like protein [Alteribacillus iranensis]